MRPAILSVAISLLVLTLLTNVAVTWNVGTLQQQVLFASNYADGYPAVRFALAVTTQGTLLAFCEGRQDGDFGNVNIILKRSLNGGNSWIHTTRPRRWTEHRRQPVPDRRPHHGRHPVGPQP